MTDSKDHGSQIFSFLMRVELQSLPLILTPWCSLQLLGVGVSLLTFFFVFFGVTVFFGLGFESPTGVSGTVAALAASLLAGVVFGTS